MIPIRTGVRVADQVGVSVFEAMPLYHRIETHVLSAERLHGDDTTMPILAKGKTVTGRIWTYVGDERAFGVKPELCWVISGGYDSLRSAKTTENRVAWTEITREQYDRRHLRYASDCKEEE